jgi:hypothetical protein
MIRFLIVLILLSFISCKPNQEKFNRKKWNYIDGSYNHRDIMIKDLMETKLQKGMKYSEVEKILGKPNEGQFNKKITYEIYYDFYKEEHRELDIYFSNDSTIINFKRIIWFSK